MANVSLSQEQLDSIISAINNRFKNPLIVQKIISGYASGSIYTVLPIALKNLRSFRFEFDFRNLSNSSITYTLSALSGRSIGGYSRKDIFSGSTVVSSISSTPNYSFVATSGSAISISGRVKIIGADMIVEGKCCYDYNKHDLFSFYLRDASVYGFENLYLSTSGQPIDVGGQCRIYSDM